jgi:hypothetical protein
LRLGRMILYGSTTVIEGVCPGLTYPLVNCGGVGVMARSN